MPAHSPRLLAEAAPGADAAPFVDLARRASTRQLLQILVGDEVLPAFDAIGTLRQLLAAPPPALGPVALARLCALDAVVTRVVGEARPGGQVISGPEDLARCCAALAVLEHEEFHVIALNVRHVVLASVRVASGTVAEVEVHPSDVFRPALLHRASALAFVHNHPSGDPSPSPADVALTDRLTAAGQLIGLRVLDHVVIGAGRRAYSFATRELFSF